MGVILDFVALWLRVRIKQALVETMLLAKSGKSPPARSASGASGPIKGVVRGRTTYDEHVRCFGAAECDTMRRSSDRAARGAAGTGDGGVVRVWMQRAMSRGLSWGTAGILLLLLHFCSVQAPAAGTSVVINEIMAVNRTIVRGPQLQYEDWGGF